MIHRALNIESNDNSLFVTAQCNNKCVMCCQPPTQCDDIEKYFIQNIELIKSAPKGLKNIGITGGEPTLLGDKLFEYIRIIREYLPDTSIHILSNGRIFKDADYTHKLKDAGGEKLFVGVPLHSDFINDHNHIAGAESAYEETITGLYNLASEEICIELRIVINALNYTRLPQMAEFIFKNLTFVSWVALMGMEHIGYAIKNQSTIWIEPKQYSTQLADATLYLSQVGIPVSIYNVPLCLLDKRVHKYACQSISDWKTLYLDECEMCSMRSDCCGLFATSHRIFKGIKAL